MTQQILYDTETGAIIQWQDTTAFNYPYPPPAGTAILAVTAAQWAAQDTAQHVTSGVLLAGAAPDPPLSPEQQAQNALAAGVKIESTSTPALNGTYACAGPLFDDMVQEISAIAAGIGLIGGGSTMPWVDQNGTQHTLTQAQFLAIAGAVRNYVVSCKQVIAGVSGAAIPAQVVTIP